MYPSLLGRFIVPSQSWETGPAGWVPGVTYQAEPPIVVRGAMNPWNAERQRVVWQAEETAWTGIQGKQAEYRRVYARLQAVIAKMNHVVLELESLTGKKAGLFTVENIASVLVSAGGNPYLIAAMFLKTFVFDAIMGQKKKKKIEGLMRQLEAFQVQARVYVGQLHKIEAEVTGLIQTGDRLRGMQQVTVTKDMAQAERAYQSRQALERVRASALLEHNRQVALLPRKRGGDDGSL